jgi:hypothetical protein
MASFPLSIPSHLLPPLRNAIGAVAGVASLQYAASTLGVQATVQSLQASPSLQLLADIARRTGHEDKAASIFDTRNPLPTYFGLEAAGESLIAVTRDHPDSRPEIVVLAEEDVKTALDRIFTLDMEGTPDDAERFARFAEGLDAEKIDPRLLQVIRRYASRLPDEWKTAEVVVEAFRESSREAGAPVERTEGAARNLALRLVSQFPTDDDRELAQYAQLISAEEIDVAMGVLPSTEIQLGTR